MSVTIRNHKLKIKRWRWPTYETKLKLSSFAGKTVCMIYLLREWWYKSAHYSALVCSLPVRQRKQAAFWNANAKFDEHMLNFATFFDRAMWCAERCVCTSVWLAGSLTRTNGQQVNRPAFRCSRIRMRRSDNLKSHRRCCPNWFHWQWSPALPLIEQCVQTLKIVQKIRSSELRQQCSVECTCTPFLIRLDLGH